MALDPNIFSNIGVGVTPLLNPLDVQAKKIAIQNSLANGQLTQLDLQQRRQAIAADQKFRDLVNAGQTAPTAPGANSLATAPAAPVAPPSPSSGLPFDPQTGMNPDPTGSAAAAPTPAPAAPAAPAPASAPPTAAHEVSDDQILGIFGQAGYGLIKARNDSRNVQAQTQDTLAKVASQNNDYWGHLYAGLKTVNYDSRAVMGVLSQAQADGKQITPQFQQLATAVQSNPTAIPQLGEVAIQRSPEALKAVSEGKTADAAVVTANEKKQTSDREAANQARSQNIAALAAAPNGAAYGAVWSKLPPELRADASIPNPSQWTPQTPAMLRNVGMSPEQQATSAETKTRDAATVANERTARNQEQQNIGLRNAEFNQKYSPTAIQIAPADLPRIQAIHNGDIPAPSPRSTGYQKTMDQVYSLDKPGDAYTQARYTTNQDFLTKGDSDKVASLATALSHLDRAQTNSAALGFSPTQSLNVTPTQRNYHTDVAFLSGELGKFIKNNELTQAEGDRIVGNMSSAFQATRDAGLNEAKDLMGGKFQAIRQKYLNGAGRDLPLSMFDQATQQRLIAQKLVAAPASSSSAPSAAPTPSSPAAAPAPAPGAAPGKPAKSLDDIFGGGGGN